MTQQLHEIGLFEHDNVGLEGVVSVLQLLLLGRLDESSTKRVLQIWENASHRTQV